jgi:hypothetical protein
MTKKTVAQTLVVSAMLALAGCPQSGVKTGGSENLITGSAGGSSSVNANKSLERCSTPLGTLAVSDGRYSGATSVTTVDPLIRLAVQQSNCFVLTSIGNIATDSQLDRITDKQRNSGEFRAGSNQQKGQQVAADYFLDPQVIVQNEQTGGTAGGLAGSLAGAALGSLGGALVGGVAGAMETRTSDVALTLTDIRSRVQIAIAQGSSTVNNMSIGGAGGYGGWGSLLGGGIGGGIGTFTRTPEGVAIAAAFFDAYNSMVQSLRNYKAQDVPGGMGRGGLLKVN